MNAELNYQKDFVENHLIAYIGNKRRLLPLLVKAIKELETNGSTKIEPKGKFLDLFAGTGVVSRLAKSLGYQVLSNDWEHYSHLINKAFLENDESIWESFNEFGGIEALLERLNSLTEFNNEHEYISKYYCPEDDDHPDTYRERMFYTRANGILIDNIRAEIDKIFIGKNEGIHQKQKDILLSLLLYEASTRSNTNGVFKGFHNGFGGRNGDALNRILKKITLTKPELSHNTVECTVTNLDANVLLENIQEEQVEIAYLDPPYNQHQYGSNYHLLNTILKNDCPKVNKEFLINGKKVDKSAIRKDWVNTRSPFCYKKSGSDEFKKIIQKVNAKYLLVSYSTEGIIDFDEMLQVLAEKGKVGIVTTGYVRFRGGRQSLQTKTKNIEFVLIVDTGLKSNESDIKNVKGVILGNSFSNYFSETFPIYVADPQFNVSITPEGKRSVSFLPLGLELELDDHLRIIGGSLERIQQLSFMEQKMLFKALQDIMAYSNDYELEFLLKILDEKNARLDNKYFTQRVINLFNKINPKKNKNVFVRLREMIQEQHERSGFLYQDMKMLKKFFSIQEIKAPAA